MKMFKRLAAVALALVLCVSMAGCASDSEKTKEVDTLRYNDVSYSSDVRESGVIVENDTWQLNWDNKDKRVSFTEKATGAVWGTTPPEATVTTYDESGAIVKNNGQIESALQVYYFNPENAFEESCLSYLDAVLDGDVYAQKLENGLRVIYDFMAYEIIVPVDFTLEGDQFKVSVDPTLIADNGKRVVTAFDLAPFMCSVPNDSEDGWLFMPDGSGAISRPMTLSTMGTQGMKRVYGEDLAIQRYELDSVTQQYYMPVFGACKGDNALFAVIDSGDEQSSVGWNIGSKTNRYSSVFAHFAIRGYTRVPPPRGFNAGASYIKVFADYISPSPVSVTFYPLSGEKANVSGMAQTYQQYLLDEGMLVKSETPEKSVALKYVGGTIQPSFVLGLPTTKLFPLTTTAQAEEMTKAFAEELGNDFYVNLVGFGQSGVDIDKFAGGFTTASELGGVKGMQSLSNTMKSLDLPWYMDFDLIAFQKGSNGFTKASSSALWPNQQVSYFFMYNLMTRMSYKDRYYMLARRELAPAVKTLVDKADTLQLQGVSLDSLSHTIYSDYADASTQLSNGIQEDAINAFSTIKDAGYNTLADSANVYVAGQAGAIIDAPLYSSSYDFIVEDVPFYEMVLRGYVPMSSTSINLAANEKDALLRCVESGIAPSYTLTYEYDNELISSRHNFIYGSAYAGNRERILEQVASVQEYLDSIQGAKIVENKTIAEDVRLTVFDNGVYAVVNFGDADVATAYGQVPAAGWITGRDA